MNLPRFLEILELLDRDYDVRELIRDRLGKYVDNRCYRADVVQTIPSSAPAGYLMVTPGDPNLYIGAGTASPLRRIPTQAVP